MWLTSFKSLQYLCQMEAFCTSLHIWILLHTVFFCSLTVPCSSGQIYAVFFPGGTFSYGLYWVLFSSPSPQTQTNHFLQDLFSFLAVQTFSVLVLIFILFHFLFITSYSELHTEALTLFSIKNITMYKVYSMLYRSWKKEDLNKKMSF